MHTHRDAERRVNLHLLGAVRGDDGDEGDVDEGVSLGNAVDVGRAALGSDSGLDLLGQGVPRLAHHLEPPALLVET